MGKGILPTCFQPQNWMMQGASVPYTFQLDHLQPLKFTFFFNFCNFFTFILVSQFLLLQKGANKSQVQRATGP